MVIGAVAKQGYEGNEYAYEEKSCVFAWSGDIIAESHFCRQFTNAWN
jgi:hypothetical protein